MGDLTGLRAPQGTDATAHSSVDISSDSSARAAIRLRDYEIKGVIGEGGIGVVYRARHLVSDKPVAIKVLHEYCGRQKDLVEKLFVEAKAASRIHHPNITDVTDFGTAADGSVFVATDYLDGESLEDRLRRVHRLPLFEAINIVRQVAHGLGAAHELGIVHRDLKPANIFLCSREGRRRIVRRSKETGMRFTIVPEKTFDLVKLMDFGASSFIDFDPSAQTPAEVVCRRPYYLSPEQTQGRPTDQRCDIYALGAVFYQMVTGTIPVSGETVPAIINALATGSVIAPSRRAPEAGTSLRIDSLILKCLNRNPSLRFASTAELCTALDACLGDCAYLRDAHRLPGIQFSGIDLSQASLEARQNAAPATPAEQKLPAEPIAQAAKVAPQTIALGTLLHEARATASRVPQPVVQSVPKKTVAKREAQVDGQVDGQVEETGEKWAPTKGAQKVIVVSGAPAQAEATVAKPPAEPIAKAAKVGPQTIAWGTFRNEARANASRVPRPNVQSVPKKTDAKREAQVDGQLMETGEKRAPTKGSQKVIVVSGVLAQAEATVAATPAIEATPALEKYERSLAPWLIAIGGVLLVGLAIAFWPERDGASRTAQPAATIATPASTPAAPERPAAIAPAATPVAPAPSAPAASAAAPVPAIPAAPATAPAVVAPETPPAPAVLAAAPQGEENTIRVAKAASSASHRGHHKKERGAVAVSSRVSDEARSPTAKPAATAKIAARPETEPESSADPFAPSEPEASEGSMGSPTGSSSSVEDRMREAQRASRKGHHKSAIRKARAVLKAEPKPGQVMQAYQIIATSSCALGKVAGAREAASHLDKPALAAVRAACKKDGVAIE
jgi:serine/threonine protein kinase